MKPPHRCPNCSAPVTEPRSEGCGYCGAVLAPSSTAVLESNVSARFAAVERSPTYPELMMHVPDASAYVNSYVFFLVFCVIWSIMAAAITVPFLITGPLVVIPLAMCLLGVVGFFHILGRMRRFQAAPLERVIAIVRDERIEVSGGGKLGPTTHHHVLLEQRDGRRAEHRCSASISARVAPGDIGVAYLKDDVVLEFSVVRASDRAIAAIPQSAR